LLKTFQHSCLPAFGGKMGECYLLSSAKVTMWSKKCEGCAPAAASALGTKDSSVRPGRLLVSKIKMPRVGWIIKSLRE